MQFREFDLVGGARSTMGTKIHASRYRTRRVGISVTRQDGSHRRPHVTHARSELGLNQLDPAMEIQRGTLKNPARWYQDTAIGKSPAAVQIPPAAECASRSPSQQPARKEGGLKLSHALDEVSMIAEKFRVLAEADGKGMQIDNGHAFRAHHLTGQPIVPNTVFGVSLEAQSFLPVVDRIHAVSGSHLDNRNISFLCAVHGQLQVLPIVDCRDVDLARRAIDLDVVQSAVQEDNVRLQSRWSQ